MPENPLVAVSTGFAFRLFAELVGRQPAANIFVSPASVALALAMAYDGARGETRRAMAEALGLGRLGAEDVGRTAAELLQSLDLADPQVRLTIASSLWAGDGVVFEPAFVRHGQERYRAEIEQLEPGGADAAAAVNAWVQRRTGGKIAQIVDQIDPAVALLLINAIYFKGSWARKFDQRLTSERPFALLDGRRKPHPLMSQSGMYQYYDGRGFQAVRLPYSGGRLSMYVFLPAPRSSLAAFYAELSSRSWESWMGRFHVSEGEIALPRFKLEYEVRLNDALKALGMAAAFGERADFSGMARGERLRIDEVKHKTFVEVGEEGTEAAAVTAAPMVLGAFMPEERFSMVVDRPFFCAIRDDQTGAVLFMGSIVEPK